jgi:ubiquinone/menaquinone biosynthesis C-methylase UbiE
MPDVYSIITEVEPAVVAQVATAMEVSAADPQHRAMVEAYLNDLGPSPDTRVVEIGCGTGAIARMIATRPGVTEVVGTDPSPILINHAAHLSEGLANLSFQEADGRDLPMPDASFDVAVLHRVLSHAPGPEQLLAEAYRVLRPGGQIVVFDGDYSTITLATGDHDPLQVCVHAMVQAFVNDPWVVRRLPAMVETAGFGGGRFRSYGFVQIRDADYLVGIADRGADALTASGRIGPELADALKAEARRRVHDGSFFGHIAYASVIAAKPASSHAPT